MHSNIVTLITAIAVVYVTTWSYLHYNNLSGRRYSVLAAVSVIMLLLEYVLLVKVAPASSSMSSTRATLALVICIFSWVVCDIAGYRRERKRQFS